MQTKHYNKAYKTLQLSNYNPPMSAVQSWQQRASEQHREYISARRDSVVATFFSCRLSVCTSTLEFVSACLQSYKLGSTFLPGCLSAYVGVYVLLCVCVCSTERRIWSERKIEGERKRLETGWGTMGWIWLRVGMAGRVCGALLSQ